MFINWIQDKNVCKNYVKRFKITILGNLIKIILEESGDKKLLSISQKHDLITDLETLNNFKNIPEEIHSQSTFRYDVFICHSSNDKQFIKENILPKLQQQRINYWFDDDKIGWGENIPMKVQDGLKKSRYIMLCLSDNFLSSIWTKAEYSAVIMNILSRSSEQGIKPLKIDTFDDEKIPEFIQPLKYLDYFDYDNQAVFTELLKSLRS